VKRGANTLRPAATVAAQRLSAEAEEEGRRIKAQIVLVNPHVMLHENQEVVK
jgi:hypothetical protein